MKAIQFDAFGDADVLQIRNVPGYKVGDRVMGIAGGGAYAELARLDYRMALPLPDNLDLVEAAGIMEVFVAAHEALIHLAQLQPAVPKDRVEIVQRRGCFDKTSVRAWAFGPSRCSFLNGVQCQFEPTSPKACFSGPRNAS
ncbi:MULTISPECIES: MDR/zinc-dependent alcohol dehydrogenase-like family protein [unclassified Novosphingobium]|uniref:hypothetical protein n=1 Tax=unclassified Novosphingobium TaxID=2644732 RepID=UPI001AC8833A|nr:MULTISPECIES: hypothetical protein [unclassified Novosphingobium]MBN9146416.1 hypothetical protein [Novosphingobium sp.]MDR6708359.1 hypothetical protein [Novosphingobium sp. 1748]